MKITSSHVAKFVTINPYVSEVDPTTSRYQVEHNGHLYVDTCSLERAKEEQNRLIERIQQRLNEAVSLLKEHGFTVS